MEVHDENWSENMKLSKFNKFGLYGLTLAGMAFSSMAFAEKDVVYPSAAQLP